jgi:CARDB
MNQRNTILALFAVAAAFPVSARASDPSPCGTGFGKLHQGYLGIAARNSDFPVGSEYRSALVDVAEAWSNTKSKVEYSLTFTNGAGAEPEIGNGVSEVFFVDNLYPQAMAVTWKSPPTCTISEADVIILDSFDWSASTDPDDLNSYTGPSSSFRTMLFHELGHAQGLGHTSTVYSVMGQDSTHVHLNDGIVTAYAGEDAITKSAAIYGTVSGSHEDLGLTHWKRYSEFGQYSLHQRTLVKSVNGSYVAQIDFGDAQFEVEVGEQVRLEFTAENFGKNAQNARIGYYLSSNDHITTQDLFLTSEMRQVNPDTPSTILSPAITIPADLPGGTEYWLGAIIDDNKQINETNEWNNRTSIRVRTSELPENLVAVSVAGPAKAKAGTQVFVASNVVNGGGGYIPQFTYEVRLSKNTTITQSDPLVESFTTSELGAHVDFVTIPANLPSGDYYWGLRVLSVSGESSTSDNRVAGGAIKITKGDPDLVAYGIAGPLTIEVGEDVSVQCAVTNEGGLTMGPYSYKIYLSQDDDIEPTDILLKSVTTFNLGTKIVNFKVPALPAVGAYRIGFIVSPAFGETDLSDNGLLGNVVFVTSIDGTPGDVTGG